MKQPQTYVEQAKSYGDQAVRKLFGLPEGWHRNLDIVKNNYNLGVRNLEAGNYKDAEFRLKFLVWMDAGHKDGWYQLARAQVALGKKADAANSIKKLLMLDAEHAEARQLLAALQGKKPTSTTVQITLETDANSLYVIHKESFPIYWKESEISDMLLTSGTQAWCARTDKPLAMLMTRAQFEQAEILTLAVIPEVRRKHLAEKLLLGAHKVLADQGVKKLFLEVAEDNEAALALYRKLGYAETSRRKGYYKQENGNTTDALVMSKEIA